MQTVLAVGCGRGVAETTLAIEFPHIDFYLTDIASPHTPNYQQAEAMVHQWGIPNVTFGVMDIFDPPPRTYDLVSSVEVLEHLESDAAAARALRALSRRAVFTLVPFADDASNADEARRKRAWETNEHFRVGYDERRLRELFPNTDIVRGTYWSDAGRKLRTYLQDADADDVRASVPGLMRQARADVRDAVPHVSSEAAGIWCLCFV